MCFFSIIIPVYNSEKTILEVLQSVKGQSFTDFEIVLIDDGSTDNSKLLLESFRDQNTSLRVKLICLENGGVSRARNAGIKMASGKYLAFLDADDTWHPDKLKLMQPILSDEYSVFGHGSTLNNFESTWVKNPNVNTLKVFTYFDFLKRNRFVTPSVIVRNSGGVLFDEKMRYAEDHDLWLRLSFKRPALYLDIKLVKLDRPVLSAGGASSARWKMRKGELKMYCKSARYSLFSFFSLPLLLSFSILKHIKSLIKLL